MPEVKLLISMPHGKCAWLLGKKFVSLFFGGFKIAIIKLYI